ATQIQSDTGLLHSTMLPVPVGSLRGKHLACRRPSDIGVFDPFVVWHWRGPSIAPQAAAVFGPVLVGQFTDDNGDGAVTPDDRPEAVFMSGGSPRVLNLIDASTGLEHWAVQVDGLNYLGTPAFGDLNGDGVPEIVASVGTNGSQVRAFDAQGQELWRASVPTHSISGGAPRDAIAIAALEGRSVEHTSALQSRQ